MSSQAFIFNPSVDRLAAAGNGFQLPGLTTSQRLALSVTVADKGLEVFDTTLNTVMVWDGTGWVIGGSAVVQITDAGAAVTLTSAMNGALLILTSAAAVVVDVPATLPSNFAITVLQFGTGVATFTGSGGASVVNRQGDASTAGQYALVALVRADATTFALGGDTA